MEKSTQGTDNSYKPSVEKLREQLAVLKNAMAMFGSDKKGDKDEVAWLEAEIAKREAEENQKVENVQATVEA